MAATPAPLKVLGQPPIQQARSCLICTDSFGNEPDEPELVRPCRIGCGHDFCVTCLAAMFQAAIHEGGDRMPPRCCTAIQLHTILPHLKTEDAQAYRRKLQEWLTQHKVYCPSPSCSAFIAEDRVPHAQKKSQALSTQETLLEIVDAASQCAAARSFRTRDLQDTLPRKEIISRPIDLATMRGRILDLTYKTADDVNSAFDLLVTNAQEYYGQALNKSVIEAAKQLKIFAASMLKTCKSSLPLPATDASSVPILFPCPSCHIAICVDCHQIAHDGVCDRSDQDQQAVMLKTFGYKRCPRCGHGVKKMFGCPHVQCVCGAHWCYKCEKALDQCFGCGDESETEEDSTDESDSEGTVQNDTTLAVNPTAAAYMSQTSQQTQNPLWVPTIQPARAQPPVTHFHGSAQPEQNLSTPASQHAAGGGNLDGGGANRWANTDLDFGEEPDDDPYIQPWSCPHKFELYKLIDDGYYRGDHTRMDCNRCLTHLEILDQRNRSKTKIKRRKMDGKVANVVPNDVRSTEVEKDLVAWECASCHIVTCRSCKEKYVEGK